MKQPAALTLLTTILCFTALFSRAADETEAEASRVIDLGDSIGLELIWIDPGAFVMGSRDSEKGRGRGETQQHVTVTNGFWIGKHEVTQAQWQQVMGGNPSRFEGAGNPVESVSWIDCQRFIKQLNSKGIAGEFRLPTEKEWEYACRAGTTTVFHYGDRLDATMANFNGERPYGCEEKGAYRRKTVPVGAFTPNAWGLYDMHGNVWEWCVDRYGDDSPDPDLRRVLRGGSLYSGGQNCRSAYRSWDETSDRYGNNGLRVVLSAVE